MDLNSQLLEFIDKSRSQFHAISETESILIKNGFVELSEGELWDNLDRGAYFVKRNGSSLVAFVLGDGPIDAFNVVAAHSDSPTLRVKDNPVMKAEKYVKLNVEKYGGALLNPWFDRPLSIAGRAVISSDNGVESRLIDFDKNMCMICNLCIHHNREANDGYKISVQKDMLPLISMSEDFSLKELVAKQLEVEESRILDMDLYLYNRDKGTIWGPEDEFLSARRLDDLACVFAGLKAISECVTDQSAKSESAKADLSTGDVSNVCNILCIFDNEEVGSSTRQGAMATFLYDTLIRINESKGGSYSDHLRAVHNGFMLSADNAQASHPNHMEKSCPTNKVFLNEGVVLKYSANQKYTTDALSGAVFKKLCQDNGIEYQVYHNNSDIAGGSTLGNISATNVSLATVDIGLPQLAMHSCFETCGSKDLEDMYKVMKAFYMKGVGSFC